MSLQNSDHLYSLTLNQRLRSCSLRHTLLRAAAGSLGGDDKESFKRESSKVESDTSQNPESRGSGETEISDKVANQTKCALTKTPLLVVPNRSQKCNYNNIKNTPFNTQQQQPPFLVERDFDISPKVLEKGLRRWGSPNLKVMCARRHMPLTAVELLKDTVNILYKNFWPLILIFALTDLSMFVLHRVSHRITNEGELPCPPACSHMTLRSGRSVAPFEQRADTCSTRVLQVGNVHLAAPEEHACICNQH